VLQLYLRTIFGRLNPWRWEKWNASLINHIFDTNTEINFQSLLKIWGFWFLSLERDWWEHKTKIHAIWRCIWVKIDFDLRKKKMMIKMKMVIKTFISSYTFSRFFLKRMYMCTL
jgi:hypothetical protein